MYNDYKFTVFRCLFTGIWWLWVAIYQEKYDKQTKDYKTQDSVWDWEADGVDGEEIWRIDKF